MVGWVKDLGGGRRRWYCKRKSLQISSLQRLASLAYMQSIKLNFNNSLWYVILFTSRFSFLTNYVTVSPVFALRKIDCLTFQSAYPEHLVKSVIAFVYLALEETEGIAPGCRTGDIGHECH